MNISDFLRTALLNHALGVAPYTPPTTIWAALYITPPTSAGGGGEVSASGYARVTTSWEVASLGEIANLADIRFPASGVALANWGTVNTLGLFDAPTIGNLLFFGSLSAPVLVNLGDDFKVAASNLTIDLD